ncbi:methyltransferase small domain protein [Clostridium botulinum]|uniref:class I SAM-dependent methyltransferase n=1 Tax=Clostridium botulinum TaxID=1491 RepID=UPI0009475384|nr:methyltransferase domain-containing protein [Clostridium botulinum]APQ99120.1 methyltransferase small domain protein [Clostridium botulinum]OSA82962.1 hypothetical protein B2H84_03960 [Clostridium botulinum]
MGAEVEYDKMNWLYNALYGDMTTEQIKNIDFIKNHIELLEKYPAEKSAVIDTACGNGVQATALATHGYKVTATDASKEMIELTNESSQNHNVILQTQKKNGLNYHKYTIKNLILYSVQGIHFQEIMIGTIYMLKKLNKFIKHRIIRLNFTVFLRCTSNILSSKIIYFFYFIK